MARKDATLLWHLGHRMRVRENTCPPVTLHCLPRTLGCAASCSPLSPLILPSVFFCIPFQTEMLTVCCCILPDTWHRSFPHWHFCATVLRTQIFCSFLIFSVCLCMLRFGLAVLPCRSSPKPLREWQPLLSSSSLMRIIISLPHNTFQCSTTYNSVAGTCFQEQIL